MAVKSDAKELADALAAAVNAMAADGRLQQIFERANVSWQRV
jgi:hypothetical protein